MVDFLDSLGVSVKPVVINADNQGSIALTKNSMFHDRSKHIDIQYHFARDTTQASRMTTITQANRQRTLSPAAIDTEMREGICIEIRPVKELWRVGRDTMVICGPLIFGDNVWADDGSIRSHANLRGEC